MYKITKLKNGLRVLTVPIKQTKAVTALVLVRAGSRNETKREGGLAHFIEHMFFKGGKKYPNMLAVSEAIDGAGGIFNAFTGKETVGYWIKIAAEKLPLALDVLSDMLLSAQFEPQEIDRERGVILEEINLYEDTPLYFIYDLFEQTLYGDTSLGRSPLGQKINILNFKQRNFLNYIGKFYAPSNMVICLAGNINHQKAIKGINKYFNFQTQKTSHFEKFKKKQGKAQVTLKSKKTDQAHLSLGFPALPFNSPLAPTLEVLNAVLGASMSSRLFMAIREREGLAYSIRSTSENYSDNGYWQVYIGTPIDKVEKTIKLSLLELKKIKEMPLSIREIKKGQEYIKGRVILNAEDSEFVANYFAEQALLVPNKIETLEQFFNEINKVTPAKIQALARKLFTNQGLNLAVIGPLKDKSKFEKLLKI